MNNTQIVNSLNIKEIDPSYFKYFSWTNLQKKFLIACLDFFDNGGGFYDDGYDEDKVQFSPHTIGEDIGTILFSKNMQPEEELKDKAISNIAKDFGYIPNFSLYRGLSENELNNILDFINLKQGNLKKCKLVHSKAFSSDTNIAKRFASSYKGRVLTIQKCNQKIVNVEELTYLAKLANYIYDDNIDEFKENYTIEKDSILMEQEYSIPKDVIFEIVDIDNLIFNVI